MSDLTQRFEQASKDVQGIPSKPDNNTLLDLYALYKQGTQGDCSGRRPGALSMVKRAKFDAWKKREGTSRDDAMQSYIDLVERLKG